MKILILGGAGFVGFSLANLYRNKYPNAKIVILDNLKRRGTEFNLPLFKKLNIDFYHGDVRMWQDFEQLSLSFDIMIDACAEPSVLSGISDNRRYVLDTNINGTVNALEFAKKNAGIFIFLSTSRVYSIKALNSIKLIKDNNRFISPENILINETFDVSGARSFYGSSKLCSEQLVQEYSYAFNMKTIINRCGVLTGPGQWGKVDQGVFALWLINHYFKKTLAYHGHGGTGLQVRDLLHPKDLFNLLELQTNNLSKIENRPYNVGGGFLNSVSLCELTKICQKITGNEIEISSKEETHIMDIPYYISDNSLVNKNFNFVPKISLEELFSDIFSWIKSNEQTLKGFFI